jgi:hypothetical protein
MSLHIYERKITSLQSRIESFPALLTQEKGSKSLKHPSYLAKWPDWEIPPHRTLGGKTFPANSEIPFLGEKVLSKLSISKLSMTNDQILSNLGVKILTLKFQLLGLKLL